MAVGRARFEFEGVDALLRKIAVLRAGRELRRLIRTTLREAARPVLATAKQIAPVGETGGLRRTLKLRSAKRSRRGIGVVIKPGTREELGIKATAKGYYPAHVALGQKARGRRPAVEETRYLRDAVELEKERAIATISKDIGQGIVKIARGS